MVATATYNGVNAWSDVAMRHFVKELMSERLWGAERLAVEMGVYTTPLQNFLDGGPARTLFQHRLKRYLTAIGYPNVDPIDVRPGAGDVETLTVEPKPEPAQAEPQPVPIEPEPAPIPVSQNGHASFPPAGFQLLAPLPPFGGSPKPPGIVIGAKYERTALTRALIAALGTPAAVQVAADDRTKSIVLIAAGPNAEAPFPITRKSGISTAVSRWCERQNIPAGFYPAMFDDGVAVVDFAKGAATK